MQSPNGQVTVGMDALPESIRSSKILDAPALALLAGVPEIPAIDAAWHNERLKTIFQYYSIDPAEMEQELHLYAAELLHQNKVDDAWQVLLSLG